MNTPRGSRANAEFALPQLSNFPNPLRTLTADDSDIATVGATATNCIDLSASRYGTGNVIHLFVKGPVGVVVDLYIKEKNDDASFTYYFCQTFTTTVINQEVKFFDLVAGVYVPYVTGTTNPTLLSGGGTK